MRSERPVIPSTRQTIARLWQLSRALRKRRPEDRLNCRTLAIQFDVCEKTVRRDIEFLRDLGHDLTYDADAYSFRYVCPPTETYL